MARVRVAQPPPAAIAQRDRCQRQAQSVRWDILVRAAPVTRNNVQLVPSRLLGPRPAPRARPPPAAFAQRDHRQPQAQSVRWGIIVRAEPVTSNNLSLIHI